MGRSKSVVRTYTYTCTGVTLAAALVCSIEMINSTGSWNALTVHVENDTNANLTLFAEMGTAAIGSALSSAKLLYMWEPNDHEAHTSEAVSTGTNKMVIIAPQLLYGDSGYGFSLPPINSEMVYLLATGTTPTGVVTFHVALGNL